MKKRKSTFILAAIVVMLLAACVLAACNGGGQQQGHVHDYVEVSAKQPTCVQAGNILYYTCSCGKYFDAEKREIALSDTILAATGVHTPGEWIVDIQPNCVDTGHRYKKCVDCGEQLQQETMPTTGIHSYGKVVDGKAVCENCFTEVEVYRKEGDSIFFGEYPQSLVEDSDITNALADEAGQLPTVDGENDDWTSYGYFHYDAGTEAKIEENMWYIDVQFEGAKYRGVYFTDYRCYNVYDSTTAERQKKNKYLTSTLYWFKWEPIEWIAHETDKGTMLTANLALDTQVWDTSEDSLYRDSDIRKWLNETFYNTAFDYLDKTLIPTTEVANDAASTDKEGNTYVTESTQDKVFLLSRYESENILSTKRIKPTAYAQSQGAYVCTNIKKCLGNTTWMTRSHDDHDLYVLVVSYDGTKSNDQYGRTYGILPAIYIAL